VDVWRLREFCGGGRYFGGVRFVLAWCCDGLPLRMAVLRRRWPVFDRAIAGD